jgi:hypothetical protein
MKRQTKARDLSIQDVIKLLDLGMKDDRKKLYKAAEKLAQKTTSCTLFTILKYIDAGRQVERVHTSHPKAYPVGGRKPVDPKSRKQRMLERGQVFVASNKTAITRTYSDYERILSLGITTVLNAPISANGQCLGTITISGLRGRHGKKRLEIAKVLAGLLVPALMAEISGPPRK